MTMAMDSTGRLSIRSALALAALVAVAVILAAVGVITWTAHAAEIKVKRAKTSYEQLALVTRLEAEIGHLLIDEISSIVHPRSAAKATSASDDAQRTISALIDLIGSEIGALSNEAERAREREEFKTAYAIRALFNDMQHGIERERTRVSHLDSGSAVRDFMASVAPGFEKLNSIVGSVVADERGEAGEVIDSLADLRRNMLTTSILTVLLAATLALIGATLIYRSLMRPLDALSHGSALLADGYLAHRVPVAGPPELSSLAARFNDMAERLSDQQAQLISANEGLEAAVAERTRQLEDKAQRLTDIDSARKLFFAKVGHELKTPLTVILGEADLALNKREATLHDLKLALRHICADGQFLQRRIANLLAIARSEDGRLAIELVHCDLADIVRTCIEQARAFASSRDVLLVHDANSGVTAPARGNADWLAQALLALIDNAVKFAPPGSQVEIAAVPAKDAIDLVVADEGCGVPDVDIGSVFEPYFQSGLGRQHSGTGLGLSVAKWVAEQHGGTIAARNRLPRGFEVRMTVPLS